ncbi:MAG: hypothetical protein QOI59_2108 [Gammaproteobacteria bacterium]|jgi:hypothetical protein|nr:hypothetical protein [Gammaproteobacteria bacterium]
MSVRCSRNSLCGMDVSLGDKRIDGNGQQHHTQQEYALRDACVKTDLCSLFQRQQGRIQ